MKKELKKYYNLISSELDNLVKIYSDSEYNFTTVLLVDNSIDLIKIYVNIFLKTYKLNRCLDFNEKELFMYFTNKYCTYEYYNNHNSLPVMSDCLLSLLKKVEKIYSEVSDIEN